MNEVVKVSVDGGVGVVSLNRPDRHNAFNDAMDGAFFDALDSLQNRGDVRAIVWRGEGKSFSSGRDTAELGQRAKGESDLEFIAAGHARTQVLLASTAPIVCALKGWVLGGSFERALLCDIRVAAEDARMALPEIAHGVIPDSGGTARLFQIAGHGVAADLALTGRVIDAAEALRHGIVSRVVPAEALDDEVMEIARAIASRSPLAVRFNRDVLSSLSAPAVRASMHEEMLAQTVVFASDDYRELKAAHAEKRSPEFRGR